MHQVHVFRWRYDSGKATAPKRSWISLLGIIGPPVLPRDAAGPIVWSAHLDLTSLRWVYQEHLFPHLSRSLRVTNLFTISRFNPRRPALELVAERISGSPPEENELKVLPRRSHFQFHPVRLVSVFSLPVKVAPSRKSYLRGASGASQDGILQSIWNFSKCIQLPNINKLFKV